MSGFLPTAVPEPMRLGRRYGVHESLPYEVGWGDDSGDAHALQLVEFLLSEAAAFRREGRSLVANVLDDATRSIVNACLAGAIAHDGSAARDDPRILGSGSSPSLSGRERVVLQLLPTALSERDIARELHVSPNTIHSQVRSIYRKLSVNSRAEAVSYARSASLV